MNEEQWEAERDYRYHERIGMLVGDGKPTMDQVEQAETQAAREVEKIRMAQVMRFFTDTWCEEYQKATGNRYLFQGSKDGSAAARLLKLGLPTWEIIGIAQEAWRHPDWFNCKQAASLAGFAGRFNEIREELAHPPLQNGALIHVWRDEYNRVLQKKRTIATQYGDHQNWRVVDKQRYEELKKREGELKKLLGIVV